jgi:hypothetical protein
MTRSEMVLKSTDFIRFISWKINPTPSRTAEDTCQCEMVAMWVVPEGIILRMDISARMHSGREQLLLHGTHEIASRSLQHFAPFAPML